MKVIMFGATGMVGQGVLRECLLDARVERVLAVGRTKLEQSDPKLEQIVHADAFDYASVADQLGGYDACFFCLGVSAAGMSEQAYRRITFDATLAAARMLLAASPKMTFIYVSGTGTNSSAKGGAMWARVKGETENALLGLGFAHAYMFRPGFIQPRHGIKSKTTLYRAAYAISSPLYPLLHAIAPRFVTTTEEVGRAMIEVGEHGADKTLLENGDINALAAKRAG